MNSWIWSGRVRVDVEGRQGSRIRTRDIHGKTFCFSRLSQPRQEAIGSIDRMLLRFTERGILMAGLDGETGSVVENDV